MGRRVLQGHEGRQREPEAETPARAARSDTRTLGPSTFLDLFLFHFMLGCNCGVFSLLNCVFFVGRHRLRLFVSPSSSHSACVNRQAPETSRFGLRAIETGADEALTRAINVVL